MINPKVIMVLTRNMLVIKDLKNKKSTPTILQSIAACQKEIDQLMEMYPNIQEFIDFFSKKYAENAPDEPENKLPIVGASYKKDDVEGLVEGLYVKVQTYKVNGELGKQFQYIKIDE